jgi:hypothetical protein
VRVSECPLCRRSIVIAVLGAGSSTREVELDKAAPVYTAYESIAGGEQKGVTMAERVRAGVYVLHSAVCPSKNSSYVKRGAAEHEPIDEVTERRDSRSPTA